MNRPMLIATMILIVIGAAVAQDANRPRQGPPPGGPEGGKHPLPPFLAALDPNGDGVIDAKEIANAAEALKALDANGDGQLTMDEFFPAPPAHVGTRTPPKDHKPPVDPILTALDANGDGVIDAKEIANAAEALKALDANGDGQLTMDEFFPAPPPHGERPPPPAE